MTETISDAAESAAIDAADYTGRDNLEVMAEAENYNRWLLSLVSREAEPRSRVLDFGAGCGSFAAPLAAQGFAVHCVEPDAVLRQTLSSRGLPVHRTIEELPPDSMDFIYSFNVLEHIEDDADAVRRLLRPLRRGGKLLIYVPAFQILFSSMDRKVGHFRRYRLNRLVRLLDGLDVKVLRARYADSLGFAASLAYRAIGSRDGSLNPATVKLYDRAIFPVSRALDVLLDRIVGKNLFVYAERT